MQKTTMQLVGQSPSFLSLLEKASLLRGRNTNVLIAGKSGTGKDLLAKYIHSLEKDSSRPFVDVNCAAIPENLLESELFGHERGAFTGAFDRKIGKFELANGGDIFLDEISTLKPALQAKLLRVLQEKIIYRLGSNTPIKLNFRIIAATNEHLPTLITMGVFREDLYHRLAIFNLTMPSLKERRDDIPILVKHFLDKYLQPNEGKTISKEVMDSFCAYDWPGNVRELENLIHSLIIVTYGKEIVEISDLNQCWSEKNDCTTLPRIKVVDQMDLDQIIQPLNAYLKSVRHDYILSILQKMSWNYTKASKKLGINRTTLYRYLEEMKLEEMTWNCI